MRYSNGRWMMEWNTILYTKGIATENGFTVELEIPFRSIQYPGDATNWKVMLTRKIPTEGAKYSYPKMRRRHPQMFNQAVPLLGIQPPKNKASVQIQPTVSGRHTMLKDEGQDLSWTGIDPWIDTVRPSMDVRWGITPDTTMSLTANPDFSQVEGDVRQVNLNQRFAFFYPERRPFFLTNMDSFQDNANTLYTRSITNPITGTKLAGHEGSWDFGLLNGIDQTPNPSVHEFGSVGFSEEEIQGYMSSTSYLRLRRDALNSGFLGVFAADKRILSTQSPFYTGDRMTYTNGFNDVIGTDLRSNLGEYSTISATASASIVGDSSTMELGSEEIISLNRSPDLGAGYHVNFTHSTPEYRKEMGFQNQSGLHQTSAEGNYITQLGERTTLFSSLGTTFHKEFDSDQFWAIKSTQSLKLNGLHNIGFNVGWFNERYQSISIDSPYVDLFWFARLHNKLSTKVFFSFSNVLDYNSLKPASEISSSAQILYRPTSSIRIDCDFIQQWYTIEDFETQTAQRVYSRLNWQFSPFLGTRFIQQSVISSETETPTLFMSALLSYIKSPGNEVYFGGTWNVFGDEALELQEQMLFAKWTHLFQY